MKGNSRDKGIIVSEGINNSDKLFKKFKKSRLSLDQENYKTARYEVRNLLLNKEKILSNGTYREHWQTKRAVENPKITLITK